MNGICHNVNVVSAISSLVKTTSWTAVKWPDLLDYLLKTAPVLAAILGILAGFFALKAALINRKTALVTLECKLAKKIYQKKTCVA